MQAFNSVRVYGTDKEAEFFLDVHTYISVFMANKHRSTKKVERSNAIRKVINIRRKRRIHREIENRFLENTQTIFTIVISYVYSWNRNTSMVKQSFWIKTFGSELKMNDCRWNELIRDKWVFYENMKFILYIIKTNMWTILTLVSQLINFVDSSLTVYIVD